MLYYGRGKKGFARHLKTREQYYVEILEDKGGGHYQFQIIDSRAHTAHVLCQSSDLVVDTEFEPWEIVSLE